MLVALAGVKSVPIGTVFRSKGEKRTKLVRFVRIPRPPEPVCRCCSRDYTSATMDSGGKGWAEFKAAARE